MIQGTSHLQLQFRVITILLRDSSCKRKLP